MQLEQRGHIRFFYRQFRVLVVVVVCARGCYSRGCTCCGRCFYSRRVTCCQGVCGKCFYSRGGTCCQGGWLRVVRGRGTAAVRATLLLLDRRGKSRRVLHAFKNNVEVLLRLWCSPHFFHLLIGGPTHGLSAARQHQLPTVAAWCRRACASEGRPPSRRGPCL